MTVQSGRARLLKYYFLCGLTLATVMYSTSLHLFVGPESTLSSRYLMKDSARSAEKDWLKKHDFIVEDAGSVGKALAARGVRHPIDMLIHARQRHKLARFHDDVVRYLIQTNEPDQARPPFKYRFLPTSTVRTLRGLLGRGFNVPTLFVGFNFVCVLAAGIWFIHYLTAQLRFSRAWALLGGVLLVVLVQVTATLPFAMLEPASMLAALPLFVFARGRKPLAFAVAAALAVAVKEVFVLWGAVWLLANIELHERRAKVWLLHGAVALAPLLTFVLIRKWMGGGAFEVSHGYDLASGEAPNYLAVRFSSWGQLWKLFVSLTLGFGAIWLGVLGARSDAFLKRVAWFVPVLVLAAVTLSGFVGRVIGLLYPILLPGFLHLVRTFAEACPKTSEEAQRH